MEITLEYTGFPKTLARRGTGIHECMFRMRPGTITAIHFTDKTDGLRLRRRNRSGYPRSRIAAREEGMPPGASGWRKPSHARRQSVPDGGTQKGGSSPPFCYFILKIAPAFFRFSTVVSSRRLKPASTVLQMLRHDEPRHLRQRAGRTGELYQQVVAGAALLHHVADAVYLPRDTRRTLAMHQRSSAARFPPCLPARACRFDGAERPAEAETRARRFVIFRPAACAKAPGTERCARSPDMPPARRGCTACAQRRPARAEPRCADSAAPFPAARYGIRAPPAGQREVFVRHGRHEVLQHCRVGGVQRNARPQQAFVGDEQYRHVRCGRHGHRALLPGCPPEYKMPPGPMRVSP